MNKVYERRAWILALCVAWMIMVEHIAPEVEMMYHRLLFVLGLWP